MCIVIDINVLALVFNVDAEEHAEFEPVRNWVMKRDGFVVIGGTRYLEELGRTERYRRLLVELDRMGRVVKLDNNAVNEEEQRVRILRPQARFDDHHIVAIFCVSGCKLFCSLDERSNELITDVALYRDAPNPPRFGKRRRIGSPRIYKGRRHIHLLSRQYVVQIREDCLAR